MHVADAATKVSLIQGPEEISLIISISFADLPFKVPVQSRPFNPTPFVDNNQIVEVVAL
jgi:hypothetical protein